MSIRRISLCGILIVLGLVGLSAFGLSKSMLVGARALGGSGEGDIELPYDAEVEYLESLGGCWIKTGIIASADIVISGAAYGINWNSVCGWNSSYC